MDRETHSGTDRETHSGTDRAVDLGGDRETARGQVRETTEASGDGASQEGASPRDDTPRSGSAAVQRRRLLALGGLLATGLTAGCLGYEVVDREAVTERRVRIAELESAVAAREERIDELEAELRTLRRRLDGPEINLLRAVDSWTQLGDVVREQTDAVAGETLTAAVNYDYPVHPAVGGAGRADASVRVRLTRDGETVVEAAEDVRLVLDRDASLAENGVELDVSDVPAGPYTLVAVVVDRITTLRSAPARTDVVLE
jgi:uncharacterized coiled-coil protein SlyX